MEPAVFCLAFAGAALLCLAMNRHHAQVFKTHPDRPRRLYLRGGGVGLLAAAFATAGAAQGWAVGTVEWVGAIGLAAIVLNVLHGFRPRWTPYASTAATALAIILVGLEKLTGL